MSSARSRNRVRHNLPLPPDSYQNALERRPLPGWPCIVADPPWPFQDTGSRMAPDWKPKRLARKGYRTLAMERILELPVKEVAAADSLLFLWTTDSHLVSGEAAAVARAWGFEPKRTWTWVKARPPELSRGAVRALARTIGTGSVAPLAAAEQWAQLVEAELELPRMAFGGGHYVRTATEKVLVCRRGRASFQVHDERDVFFAPRVWASTTGEIHSAKPPDFLRRVERVAAGPFLELFARSGRPGWTSWGDQAPK